MNKRQKKRMQEIEKLNKLENILVTSIAQWALIKDMKLKNEKREHKFTQIEQLIIDEVFLRTEATSRLETKINNLSDEIKKYKKKRLIFGRR